MRATGGLVGLLVVLGVVVMIFKFIEAPALEKGKVAHDEAQQISGRGQDGRSAMESFKTEPQLQNGKLNSLLVTDVTPDGAVEDYYGLKKGDKIIFLTTQAGLQKVSESANDDPEMAKIQVQEAFQGSRPIVVLRDGKSLTLPAPANTGVTPAPSPSAVATPQQATPAPGQPAAPAKPSAPRNIFDQANGVKNALEGQ
jgi:hypothetical protein